MSDGAALDRATKAQALLENPMYREAWDTVRNALLEQLESTPMADAHGAEDLRRCLKLLKLLRAQVELAINQGKVAAFRLEQEKERAKNPLRNFFR